MRFSMSKLQRQKLQQFDYEAHYQTWIDFNSGFLIAMESDAILPSSRELSSKDVGNIVKEWSKEQSNEWSKSRTM
jgi:hypothetical protein